ncbi:type I-E CRISPR-associated protein Cse2/CasB [Blastococcus capsensis]|uniref:type I-E CRISPR-associated protein Cse2/CasB n=1 Tax=Blastococcus capsensis TaxID=1564163 RepID=UPI00254226A4|nr:type I-E CRISPR-associated protein Cse2/CasB [Blastococcus capsensis]MDK3256656.1 type I-E CRISPR-associated protein Cse2/CasB [Blastococcus capsensis]
MTDTRPAPPRVSLEDLVGDRVSGLQARYLAGSSSGVGDLAALRRAVTGMPGEDPRTWALTVADVSPWARDDEPTAAELAAHAALTLYAVHQQSHGRAMHLRGRGLGSAVRTLGQQTNAEDAVRRRFEALGTAATFPELLHHARGLVRQLRSAGVPLDYGRLARDFLHWQDPGRIASVRLRWGRDYHRIRTDAATTETATTDPSPSEEKQ